ncbi:hypothetical protein THASP1DRAFT_20109 [Thamnocephalis sphaerospora]|uniref:C2H2-type domain-containing protein n=1 Tax=Thamnocephalis sphaerospora TaxID=78915 RepID=A0A4P9XHN7_9FUNG|nr:hypothetical protein THASP1DRAFT_20109 [Thamnocephalis sphaerospora]|eukprot:RKP05178.1 hypothetical protein THASP1DRAFT_20109 [Thamnocephalis sphaerospora]
MTVRRFDPYKLDYLVSFRQFAEYVNNRTRGRRYDDRELSEQYAAYKRDYTKRQCKKFFDAHHEMAWFREKYHPMERQRWIEEVHALKRENYEQFKLDAAAGKYDDICLDEGVTDVKTLANINADEESDTVLFVKSITPAIGREKVIEMCKSVEGFRYLAVSDPNALKRFHRFGWIAFKEGSDIKAAFDKLNNQKIEEFEFHLGFHKKVPNVKPRYAPEITNHPQRLKKDLGRIADVIAVLDDEVRSDLNGIELVNELFHKICATKLSTETNGTMESIDTWKMKKQLDLLIEYLRQVHMFCYYCGFGADNPMDLERRCPIQHYRKVGEIPESPGAYWRADYTLDKWTRALDARLDFKDKPAHKIDVEPLGGRQTEDVSTACSWDYMSKIAEQRYACTLCSKQFLGPGFVMKHLGNKHTIKVDDLVQKQFYNNYVRDPNRLMPNMQPPTNTFFPQIASAPVGTPLDQIPRIGFEPPTTPAAPLALPAMPRQVTSYVDLDAPAEGDLELNYG